MYSIIVELHEPGAGTWCDASAVAITLSNPEKLASGQAHQEDQMLHYKSPTIMLIVSIMVVLTLMPAFSSPTLAQQGPSPVDVARPLIKTVTDWDEYTGKFEAVNRVELRARVSGFLNLVDFHGGDIVKKGQVLFEIDPRPYQATLDSKSAELAAAVAEQERAKADLDRSQKLARNAAMTKRIMEERRAIKLKADAQIAVAKAALKTAELNLEFTKVRAPFTGRISDRRLDVGNLVNASESLLAVIVSTDPIYLVFTASEAAYLKYNRLNQAGKRVSSRKVANRVEARLIDESGWPHKGKMSFVDNELDPNSGTIRGRATFDNKNDFLAPGIFARLRLIGSGPYKATLIPEQAVLSDQSRKIVMVVDDKNKVSAKVVTLGPLYKGLRIIRSGLTKDDDVIVNGVLRARAGGTVIPERVTISFKSPKNIKGH